MDVSFVRYRFDEMCSYAIAMYDESFHMLNMICEQLKIYIQ